jgi:hypothetical protein
MALDACGPGFAGFLLKLPQVFQRMAVINISEWPFKQSFSLMRVR